MADKTINDLTAATAMAATDLFEIENAGGNSRKLTGAQIVSYLRRGCLLYSSGQTGLNATSDTALAFANESYDTDSLHSTVTNNSRITIPSGVSKVRLSAGSLFQNVTANAEVIGYIRKNGSGSGYAGMPHAMCDTSFTFPRVNLYSAVIPVTGGTDYFEFVINCAGDSSIDVLADFTWFACEILE